MRRTNLTCTWKIRSSIINLHMPRKIYNYEQTKTQRNSKKLTSTKIKYNSLTRFGVSTTYVLVIQFDYWGGENP